MVRVLANGRQNFRMICVRAIPTDLPEEAATMGAVLQRRAVTTESVIYIDSGRVVLGVLGSGAELGQFGTVEGPCWLDAPTAILNVQSAVDAVTQTDVLLRRLSIKEFRAWLSGCSAGVQFMMIDLG